jgi:hypothetical protein
MAADLVTSLQTPANSDELGLPVTTCPEGQLTAPLSCLAVLLPADILKPENKRFFEKRCAKWARWSRISAVRVKNAKYDQAE